MSVSFQSQAVVGCLVPAEQMYRVLDRRACGHLLPDGANFCPTCGQPAFQAVREPIYDVDAGILDGLHVVFDTDRQHFVVGPLVVKAWADRTPSLIYIRTSIDDLAQETRAVLEPLGLWDNDMFGLWAVPYVSY